MLLAQEHLVNHFLFPAELFLVARRTLDNARDVRGRHTEYAGWRVLSNRSGARAESCEAGTGGTETSPSHDHSIPKSPDREISRSQRL